MKVLVVGSGGREHALAWRLVNSPSVDEVISAPGNPGMAKLGETVDVSTNDLDALADLAIERKVDLTIVGPEIPLVAGIADVFASRGMQVFGPSKAAAEIEGSKVFCRELAQRHGVPVAQGESFDDPDKAADFARLLDDRIVVKADGLAGGKGVLICESQVQAVQVIDRVMREEMFGSAGKRVIVEEFLEGRETSIFCLTDGDARIILEPAQDYKRARDNDEGLNTGGMGSYSPVPWLEASKRQRAIDEVVMPLLDGLAAEDRPYRGCFYAGLMFTAKGPRLIEVNCRFGDPETQVLMPRLKSDLGELLFACAEGSLGAQRPVWYDDATVCVVVASDGYPEEYSTGVEVAGIARAEAIEGVNVFHAGTAEAEGKLVSTGGRVLNVTALAPTIDQARTKVYDAVDRITMSNAYARRDIALTV